ILHFIYAEALNVDLQFSECRAAIGSINCVSHYTHCEMCGVLEKHIITNGSQDIDEVGLDSHTNYKNLVVWAINKSGLAGVAHEGSKFLKNYPNAICYNIK
ncbi:unnamed protein product, partial [marine sediment metagenome]